jgi:hypothetical protein
MKFEVEISIPDTGSYDAEYLMDMIGSELAELIMMKLCLDECNVRFKSIETDITLSGVLKNK